MNPEDRQRMIEASLRVAAELDRQAQAQREAAARLIALQPKDPQ